MKYQLELTKEHLQVLSVACEFYARIRMGQFKEITWNCMDWKDCNVNDMCIRRDEAERLLLEARKQIYPDLHGYEHSYGIGKFKDADLAFDIHQVARMEFGDDRTPFSNMQLPKLRKIEEVSKGECVNGER